MNGRLGIYCKLQYKYIVLKRNNQLVKRICIYNIDFCTICVNVCICSPEYQDKLQCVSQRTLKLRLDPNHGLHHHLPVLFDYFHLSVICISVHGTLLAVHQPYVRYCVCDYFHLSIICVSVHGTLLAVHQPYVRYCMCDYFHLSIIYVFAMVQC